MNNVAKNLILFAAVAVCSLYSSTAPANAAAKSSDDLYSESIYIHKSSAEVPGAIDSNASPQGDRNGKSGSKKSNDSSSDSKTSPPNKKITPRKVDPKPLTR